MKLRNKKTGEIGLVHCDATMFSNKIGVFIDNNHIDLRNPYKVYDSLAELNAEWEDAPEEPVRHWFISGTRVYEENGYSDEGIASLESVGNHFKSKEEAEKAVAKLKAWKRLKDKGLVIKKWSHTPDMHLTTGSFLKIEGYIPSIMDNIEDLDLLFGGEE